MSSVPSTLTTVSRKLINPLLTTLGGAMEKTQLSNPDDPMMPLRFPTLRFVLLQLRALMGFALDCASFRSLYHGSGSLRAHFSWSIFEPFYLVLTTRRKAVELNSKWYINRGAPHHFFYEVNEILMDSGKPCYVTLSILL
jgi:hypothetical protein